MENTYTKPRRPIVIIEALCILVDLPGIDNLSFSS
jgi:hypothetical protein